MLYRFKSRACAELILLEAPARQLLAIIGKPPDASGIVTSAQIPAAIAALQAAVQADEARPAADTDDSDGECAEYEERTERGDAVRLRQRVAPFVEMLRRSGKAGVDVVWGV